MDAGGRAACCLQAGSGVRVPLAPLVRSIIRNPEPRISGKYSSKVQQPEPREIPHTRSSWALPSRATAHRSQVLGPEPRTTEQEGRLWEGPVPLARWPAGSVLNLPFQAASCLSCRGSTNGKLFPSPTVRFLVTLHRLTVRLPAESELAATALDVPCSLRRTSSSGWWPGVACFPVCC